MDIIPIRTNNYDLMCRLCLSIENNLISIFDETYTYLPQRIAACVNVEIYKTDKIPTTICQPCLKRVEDWYTFKQSCDDCQSKLRQWTSVCNKSLSTIIEIKEEVQSDAEDEVQVFQDEITIVKEESVAEDDYSAQLGPNEIEFEEPNPGASSDELHYSLLVPVYEKPATIHGIDAPVCAEYRGRQNKSSLTRNCRICFKEFKNVRNRIRHERTVHYISNPIFVENPEGPQLHSELEINIHQNNSDHCNSDTNGIDSNNVTIEQFAASLQLIQSTKINLYRTISEKHFSEFNRTVSQMLFDLNCFLCGTRYETHKGILGHLSKVFNIEKYSCFSCCIAFPNRSQYMIHVSNKYCEERTYLLQSEDNVLKTFQHYQCITCGALHVHKMHFDQHVVSAHLLDNYPSSCDRCNTLFNSLDEYKEHLTKPCFYNIYCSICKISIKNEQFDEHCKLHENDETEFSYDDFVNKDHDCRIKAIKIENEATVNKYSCSSCGDQFPTLDLWCEHQKVHSDNIFRCLECSRVFGTEQELYQHKSTHSNNNIKLKLYRCSDTNSYKAISDFFPSASNSPQLKPNIEVSGESETLENKQNMLKKHECKICKKQYATLTNLVNHRKRFHNDHAVFKSNRRMTCRTCKKVFRNSLSYSHHKQVCLGVNKNISYIKDIKKEPENVSHLNGNINHICSICNKSFLTERGLNVHIKNHTPKNHNVKNKELLKLSLTDIDGHICQICNKSLPTEKGLLYHYNIHMKNNINKYECQVCQVVSSNMNLLVDHFKTHSAKMLQSFYNKDNSKGTVNSPSLNMKVKQGTSSFTCNFCSMSFANQFSLDAHIKIHFYGSNISYKCTYCPMVTVSSLELTKHVKLKHRNQIKSEKRIKNNETSHRCNICKKIFFSAGNLKRHLKTHTKKCASCPKVCQNPKTYMDHMKIHNNKCRLCSKTFITMKSLLTHFSTSHSNNRLKPSVSVKNSVKNNAKIKHEKEYPFTCTECNKTFTKRKALNRHVRLGHKDKRL